MFRLLLQNIAGAIGQSQPWREYSFDLDRSPRNSRADSGGQSRAVVVRVVVKSAMGVPSVSWRLLSLK